MRVAPGQSPSPQNAQAQPPQPQAQGAQQQQGPSPGQAIEMIQQGFIVLGKIIQSSGGQLPPDDIKLFQAAAQATDAMIESLTGPSGGDQGGGGNQSPPPKSPSQPMAANEGMRSTPAGPQG